MNECPDRSFRGSFLTCVLMDEPCRFHIDLVPFNHRMKVALFMIESQLSWALANKMACETFWHVEFTCIYHFSRFCSDILDNFGSWHRWIGAKTTCPPDCFQAFLTTRTGLVEPIPWRRVKRDDAPGGGEMREAMVAWKEFSWSTKKRHGMRWDTIDLVLGKSVGHVMLIWRVFAQSSGNFPLDWSIFHSGDFWLPLQKKEIAHPADELSCNFVADLTRQILTMLESLTVQFPWTTVPVSLQKLQQASGVLEAGPL